MARLIIAAMLAVAALPEPGARPGRHGRRSPHSLAARHDLPAWHQARLSRSRPPDPPWRHRDRSARHIAGYDALRAFDQRPRGVLRLQQLGPTSVVRRAGDRARPPWARPAPLPDWPPSSMAAPLEPCRGPATAGINLASPTASASSPTGMSAGAAVGRVESPWGPPSSGPVDSARPLST